jgi:hypothetical protein
LVERSFYPANVVDSSLARAKSRPRKEILKPKAVQNEDEIGRIVFVTPFHDSLLAVPHILRDSANALQGLDATFDLIFNRPPIVAWNRGPTLKQAFAPSKLPTGEKPCPGTWKCARPSCSACSDVIEGKKVTHGNFSRKIIGHNCCDSKWVVYALICTSCNLWYIGKTFNAFKKRWSSHKSKINGAIRNYLAGVFTQSSQNSDSDL